MADSQVQPPRGALAPRSLFGDVLGFDPFRNFFTGFGTGFAHSTGLEVTRNEAGGYVVEIPVAGFKPNEIEVTLEEGILTVRGKSERRQFTRSLLLPEDIDGDNIGAKVEHGLLTLSLNVHPKAEPKKIAVTHEG